MSECEKCGYETKPVKAKKKKATYDPFGIEAMFSGGEQVDYSDESEDDDEVVF